MRIQHNIMAMSAYRNYTNNVAAMKKNLEKLSSGYKINRAGDDAAGLAISEKMRAQITGLETAQKNAKDGISLVQTAEGALTEVHDMLNRMVELATQSANGTYDNTTDRNQMQKEVDQLRDEINRIADSSNFNGINLLDGSMSSAASKIGSLTIENAGLAPTSKWEDVTGALTWASSGQAVTSATMGKVPATNVMHLHSTGEKGSIGQFTVDLGGLKVVSASGTKAAVKITIGTATFTYTASATGNAGTITASKVATALSNMTVYATKSGKLTIGAASTTTIAKGGILYTAQLNGNKVTFTAAKVAKDAVKASATAGKFTTIASSGDVPQGFNISHNYTVKATVVATSKAVFTQGFTHAGVLNAKDLKTDDPKLFGQAVVKFDATKLKDGMTITVGTVTKTFRLTGTAKTDGSEIDLTKLATATGTITNAKATAVAQAIANAFEHTATDGIEVGYDSNGNLTIGEKVANGTSTAGAAVQEAMKKYETFKKLFYIQQNNETGGQDGTARLEINTSKLFNGNTVNYTDKDGNTHTYKITTDKSNSGKAGYIYVADPKKDTATALAAAIGNGARVEGKNVIIDFAIKGGTELSELKAKAQMTGNKGLTLQIGDTADAYNQLTVMINDCHTDSLGIADISIADQDKAALAVNAIKDAINYVSDVRGTLGATQNRLDHTINNLSVMTENIQDAESTIRDVDVAEEMMAYTKNNILIQSAQAMLAQANQVPQGVLQLLQ